MKAKDRLDRKALKMALSCLISDRYPTLRKRLKRFSPLHKELFDALATFDDGNKFDSNIYYFIGNELSKTDSKAAYLAFEKGTEENNSKCLYEIAIAYATGENGYENNKNKSVELFKKIAEMNDDTFLVGKAYGKLGQLYLSKENEDLAYKYFEKGVSLNDSLSLLNLAMAYMDGDFGYRQSIQKSFELFKKVISLSNDKEEVALAYWFLGNIYSFPKYGIIDENLAFDFYEKGALLGDVYCLYSVGIHYREKLMVQESIDAFKKILISSSGYKESLLHLVYEELGDIYFFSIYGIEDEKTAFEFYEKGASLGNPQCLLQLANVYLDGLCGYTQDVPKSIALFKKVINCYGSNNVVYESQLRLAYSRLGDAHHYLEYGIEDEKTAFEFYEKGASLNDAYCLRHVYLAYWYGEFGYRQDLDQAIALCKKVIDLNNEDYERGLAFVALGLIYWCGSCQTKPNLKKARIAFKEGDESGYSKCSLLLASTYENMITDKNSSYLSSLYRKAIEKGEEPWVVGEGYRGLARVHLRSPNLDKNGTALKEILSKGMATNNPGCFLIEFRLQRKNRATDRAKLHELLVSCYNVANDYPPLFGLYLTDVEFSDFSKAELILNNMKKNSISSFPLYAGEFALIAERDYEKAINFFLLSLKEGNVEAYLFLGEIYKSEDNGSKDYNKAFNYYFEGSKKGNARCCYETAVCYKTGLGINQNFDTAIKYFIKANKLGYDCLFDIAEIYGDKGYADFNIEKQIYYYKKGANNGERKCIGKLIECYALGIGVRKNPSKMSFLIERLKEIDETSNSDNDVISKHRKLVEENLL